MNPTATNPLATLRRFVRPRAAGERCELCNACLADEHQHLFDPTGRQLYCSCDACAILFSTKEGGRLQRVPRRIVALPDFRLGDEQWESLHIPINLAFFVSSTPAGSVQVFYPSPAGATESLLTLESWQELVEQNPVLGELEPDVEALLVNRIGPARDYYVAPIDKCYELIGLIRTHWRGLSGGAEVWAEIDRFFTRLKERHA